MKHFGLVFVFALALFVQVNSAAGAEEKSGKVEPAVATVTATTTSTAPATVVTAAPASLPAATTTPTPAPTPAPTTIAKTEPSYQTTSQVVAYAPPPSSPADAATVLGTSADRYRHHNRVSLAPMGGYTGYMTRWGKHIGNEGTAGLLLEVPLADLLSLEAEGTYGRFNISYGGQPGAFGPVFRHGFNQYTFGGNLKLYVLRGVFQPYLLGGAMGVYYENMSLGPSAYGASFNRLIGAVQLGVGADIALSETIAIGPRMSWVIPTFNRPYTQTTAYNSSAPGFEEAGAIDTTFWRAMAALKISL